MAALSCSIEYCPKKNAYVAVVPLALFLPQAPEHFVSKRLAPSLPPCMDRVVNIYSLTSLLFLH